MSTTWRDDKFHDECGLFGIWNHPEAANVTYLGLYALQHRGQESAGIAATDGSAFHLEKAMGWVADVFSPERLRRLPGHRAIGHVRYSTAGSSNLRNAQPITATFARGPIAIAHNGNLTNADALRKEMERTGAIFQSNSDTEVILHLLARAPVGPLEDQIPWALAQVKGAYSVLILTRDALYAMRDPYGFRPLTLGKLGEAWIVASETCALDLMEARPERDVEPGELVVISDAGLQLVPRRARRRAAAVRVRVRLLRATGLGPVGPQRPHRAQGARASAGPRASGRGRHRHSRPRLGDQRRARLLRGSRARRSSWGSSAITTSGAPSSSPSRGSATSGSRSS